MWNDRKWCLHVLCRDKLQPQSKPTLRDLQSKTNANSSPILAFSSEPANLLNSQHSNEAPALSICPASTPQDEISLANVTVPLESIKPSKKHACVCFNVMPWTVFFFFAYSLFFLSSLASQVACYLWRSSTSTACVSFCTSHAITLRHDPTF